MVSSGVSTTDGVVERRLGATGWGRARHARMLHNVCGTAFYRLHLIAACAFAMAMIGAADPAAAEECVPVSSGATGMTVNCTGTVNNQDSPAGFGTGAQSSVVVNVANGASVTGTQLGIFLGNNITINNNAGTIEGGTSGIAV